MPHKQSGSTMFYSQQRGKNLSGAAWDHWTCAVWNHQSLSCQSQRKIMPYYYSRESFLSRESHREENGRFGGTMAGESFDRSMPKDGNGFGFGFGFGYDFGFSLIL